MQRLSWIWLVASLVPACGGDSPLNCASQGGVKGSEGLCMCPTGTLLVGTSCVELADSGPSYDAGRPDTSVTTTTANDAAVAPDNADDASIGDGAVGDAGRDALGDGGVSDAAAVVDADAGSADASTRWPPTTCTPRGTWEIKETNVPNTGNCQQFYPVPFTWDFAGHLDEPLRACPATIGPSVDGCSFTYSQDCTRDDGTVLREVGTFSMTSATTMLGNATLSQVNPDGGVPLCTTAVNIIGAPVDPP